MALLIQRPFAPLDLPFPSEISYVTIKSKRKEMQGISAEIDLFFHSHLKIHFYVWSYRETYYLIVWATSRHPFPSVLPSLLSKLWRYFLKNSLTLRRTLG